MAFEKFGAPERQKVEVPEDEKVLSEEELEKIREIEEDDGDGELDGEVAPE